MNGGDPGDVTTSTCPTTSSVDKRIAGLAALLAGSFFTGYCDPGLPRCFGIS